MSFAESASGPINATLLVLFKLFDSGNTAPNALDPDRSSTTQSSRPPLPAPAPGSPRVGAYSRSRRSVRVIKQPQRKLHAQNPTRRFSHHRLRNRPRPHLRQNRRPVQRLPSISISSSRPPAPYAPPSPRPGRSHDSATPPPRPSLKPQSHQIPIPCAGSRVSV